LLAVSVRLPAEENGKIGLLIIGVQSSVFAWWRSKNCMIMVFMHYLVKTITPYLYQILIQYSPQLQRLFPNN